MDHERSMVANVPGSQECAFFLVRVPLVPGGLVVGAFLGVFHVEVFGDAYLEQHDQGEQHREESGLHITQDILIISRPVIPEFKCSI